MATQQDREDHIVPMPTIHEHQASSLHMAGPQGTVKRARSSTATMRMRLRRRLDELEATQTNDRGSFESKLKDMQELLRGRFAYEDALHAERTHDFRRDRCDINWRVDELQAQVEGLLDPAGGFAKRLSSVESQVDMALACSQGECIAIRRGQDVVSERVEALGRVTNELSVHFHACFGEELVRSVVEHAATTPRTIAETAESAPSAQQVPGPSPRFSDSSAAGETGTITGTERLLSCS